MKNKKIKNWVWIVGIIVILGICLLYVFLGRDKEVAIIEEYTPQEEISDQQQRQTIVSIYCINRQTNTLMPEARLIDVKDLATNPYLTLMKLLTNTPKNSNLESAIPEGTQIISVEVNKEIAYINLSSEFVDNHKGGAEEEAKTIYAIVNTLTELNEINGIRILINGEENKAFNDGAINFKDNFVRLDGDDNL